MIEDKNIDRLFQEQLKDMEVTPDPKVWATIENKLQKKKRRMIPVWWFSTGIAAIFVIGLILFSDDLKNDEIKNNNFPVITDQNTKNTDKEKPNNEIDQVVSKKNEIVSEDAENKTIKTQDKVLYKTNETNSIASKTKKVFNAVEKDNSVKNSEEHTTNYSINSDKIAQKRNSKQPSTSKIKEVVPTNRILIDDKIAMKEKAKESEGAIVKGTSSDDFVGNKNILIEKKEGKKDFIAEVNKEKTIKKEEKKQDKKWAVSPVFGVLQSNSFTEASALDATLNGNTVSGENTFSYGVDLVYKLNSNWSIKSGIQLQKTAFTTKDITLSALAVLVASNLDNVSYVTPSGGDLAFSDIDELSIDNGLQIETEQGNIQQSYGYLEIPVEVKYTFFQSNTIKTSVISGFSSLFLTENTIAGESTNFGGNIGEANNLNGVNFSGNLGFDVDVMITKKLNLNINPMFKTQLNTFSKNSNGFRPYILGVYTGIRYKF